MAKPNRKDPNDNWDWWCEQCALGVIDQEVCNSFPVAGHFVPLCPACDSPLVDPGTLSNPPRKPTDTQVQ